MYDDEFELTFDLSDEDKASRAPEPEQEPVQEAAPEPAAETEPPVEPVPEPAVPAANGRCVLISGGDRGIGAAAARAFWQAGYRVAVLYHTHAEEAAALEKALPGLLAVQCDVASRASCEVAFHTVEQAVGHVDVLVSNAGIAQQKLFTDITPEEWQHMLDVNLSGAFHLCQLALPGMIRRKAGRILTVSSMWGQTGGSCEVHYSAAKAGLIGLTKSLAKEHAESFAMFSAPILRVFLLVLRPLNFLFSQWKRLLNMIFHPSEDQGITEEELITMVSEAENEGGLDQHESQLIRSAIEFGDLEAGDILTPRVDIVAVEDSASMEEIAAVFAESGYSRLPVYHKDVDDIVGVIHEKDFNAARYRGQGNISGCITPVHYTTANADLGLLLRTLQKKKTHMAIVVDEYGGTEGLLTMEGEIWDEHDEVVESFRKQSDGSFLVAAGADLSDLYDLFSIKGDCDASTVSGWVIDQLGRLPLVGDHFQAEGLDVTVTMVDHRRVLEVRVAVAAEAPETAEGAAQH